ncbi:MAG: hypothetical protein NXI22_05025 [bacterium]|nr:hypothetical protein [bacterium]
MALPNDMLIRCTLTLFAATFLFATDRAVMAQEPAAPAAEPAKPDPDAPKAAPKAAKKNNKIEILAPAKPYKQLPFAASLKDDPRRQNEIYKTVSAVLNGTKTLQENETVFKGYFTQYMFAKLTELSPETGLPKNDLPDVRTRVLRDIQRAQDPLVRELMIETTYTYMIGVVRGHFHPLAQYNAMLIIGELNSDEARTGGGNPAPPQPLPAALADMVRELENPSQNDAVRVAALVGIQRHMRLDGQQPAGQRMPAARKVATVGAVSKLIFDPRPSNRSEAGHNWMRRMAVEIVGSTHDAGVENRNAIEFARILSDEEEPLSLRYAAGLAFSQLEFDKAPPVKPKEVVASLARLTFNTSLDQLNALKAESEKRTVLLSNPTGGYDGGLGEFSEPMGRPGGEGGGLEGYGDLGGGADPFGLPDEEFGGGGAGEFGETIDVAGAALNASRQYLVDNAARRLCANLRTTDLALRGRQPATNGLLGMTTADADTKKLITDLAARYKSIYKLVAENRKDLPALTNSLEGEVGKLQTIVAKVAPKAAAAPVGLPGEETGLPGEEPVDEGDSPKAKPVDAGGLPGDEAIDDGGLPVGDDGLPGAP